MALTGTLEKKVKPADSPKDGEQVNLTDEESRIMPVSGGGFEQSDNAQAGVDTQTMMVITRHVSQACNDKREVAPALEQINALPAVRGEVQSLITGNGFFSQANLIACNKAEPDEHAGVGQGAGRMQLGDHVLEHQAHARAARGMRDKGAQVCTDHTRAKR